MTLSAFRRWHRRWTIRLVIMLVPAELLIIFAKGVINA